MNEIVEKQTDAEIKEAYRQKLFDGIRVWTAFYRANPQRFARDYLGLKLKWFQQVILNEMFRNVHAIYLASRGGGKSYLLAIFCVCYCILYPGTIICLASKTKKQAAEVIDKIITILMPNSANLRSEIAEARSSPNNSYVTFKNGSVMKVVTAAESARHNRATVLVVDEYRLVDKNVIDTILKKFLTAPRHPGYLDKPEYSNYPKERPKELYASSCWYEGHWSYDLVRSYVDNMLYGRSYFCCAIPYQLAIKEDLLDREGVEDEMSEANFNEVAFHMEMCALFWAEATSGLYRFDEVDKNRVLELPYYPRTILEKHPDKILRIPPKRDGEKRIISADLALMSSSKNKNDATSIFINQMIPSPSGRYIYNISYAENNEGMRADDQALNIRRLYDDFECDYIAIDSNGLGLPIVDLLMGEMYDKQTGEVFCALSCCNNDEIAKRCVTPGAPKVIWALRGTPEFNSRCALTLREEFRQGRIKLLKSEYDADEYLSRIKGYALLPPQEALQLKLPYIHTTLLINELINLECETKNNVVKVSEKTGMRKDRYSSLGYNIFVAKQIERDLTAQSKNATGNLLLSFRAPKIRKNYRGGK